MNDNSTNKGFSEDTYLGFANAMKLIKKNLRNMKIKNIIVDLSTNGGGDMGAMQRGLGFITDEPILNKTYNRLNEEINIRSVEVDTDGDGNYKNDAYSEYNWYLLTGVNTFSAANTFTSIFKEMKLGKIIGQKTGGGAASILPVVLPDGTSIVISSNNLSVTMKNNTIKSIEGGIEPDIYLEYKDFYNDQKLLEIIKNK
ncbi:S41 family peptidase [Metamycoplasma hominis]|uniref:S41 family peptidase n=1 Tax=Metamycoplasma hominis TaxID=2098 RepID=UPI0034D95748